jgi:predicted metalloendopeptidase
MIIGHEITHAFDATGRNYDAFGNINNWWGNESTIHFKRKSECFNKQYSNYMIGKKNLNGYLTLDENIADNGGLKLAFKTYKNIYNTDENRLKSSLKSNHLTHDKLFFIGFAQSFCAISTHYYAENSIDIDPHAFAKYRVTGALSNSYEFSKTFNCPLDSPMNPAQKCRVW